MLALAAEYAIRAPSVHSSPPWTIDLDPEHLVVRADRFRQPAGPDPKGRESVESVGAALFNVRVALAQGGWHADVERLPRADEPDVLAEVRPVAGAPDGARAVLAPWCRAVGPNGAALRRYRFPTRSCAGSPISRRPTVSC